MIASGGSDGFVKRMAMASVAASLLACEDSALDDCAPGLDSCAGTCVDTRIDWSHCGACGRACGEGIGCFGGVCTSPQPMSIPRSGHGVVVGPDERIWALGDSGMPSPTGASEAYDPSTNHWTPLPALLEKRRDVLVAVNLRGAVHAIGGQRLNVPLDTVERLDVSAETWTNSAKLTSPRGAPAVAVGRDEKIYAAWGYSELVGEPTIVPTLDVFDGLKWTAEPAPPPEVIPRFGAVAVGAEDGSILFLGGCKTGAALGMTAVDAYHPDTKTWEPLPALNFPRCAAAAVVAPDGRVFCFGGRDASGQESAAVELYDPAEKEKGWQSAASMPEPRAYMGAVAAGDGRIYVVGGWVYPNSLETTLVYDPATDRWAW